MTAASAADKLRGDRGRIYLLCHCGDTSPALQLPSARRVAVPWRGAQRSLSKVRLTVSPENCPVTFAGGARRGPDKLACVVPEKLPSGISTKFCIGTAVLRACETVPDNRPPALVRRTSHSPQRREPGTRVPCTRHVPSASWMAGAGAAGAAAGTGEAAAGAGGAAAGYWQALCTDTHAAMTSNRNDPRNQVRPFRSIIPLLDLESPSGLEENSGAVLGVGGSRQVRPVSLCHCEEVDRGIAQQPR